MSRIDQGEQSTLAPFLQRAIPIVVIVDLVLLFGTVLLYPPVLSAGGIPGLLAATAIVLVFTYILLGSPMSIRTADPGLVRQAAIAAAILA